ncbi:Cation-transporting P-type ATPase [Macleaya cordata]|uniref:Calcium-transporting ATPase n=1 Tax=Macleaya cordata TaxID=56857 RepID=A0A200QN67_MACCD|nr:Cation-transporting P-type ATPase [Macleaya cordata]
MSTKSTSSSSSSSSHAGFDCINLLPNVTSLSKPHKRWRFAFTVIYSSRVLISLAKQIISAKTKNPFFTGLSRSPSYTAINIHPNINEDTADNDQDVSFFNDNNGKNLLIDTVKEKNMEFLNKFGGVQGVVCALQTDVDNGVCGGDLDISHRRDVFGSNTYQKPSLKGFLHFVLETFRDTIILILLACAALSIGFGIKENGVKEGWYDGGSIFIAVFLVVGVSAVSNFRQSRQFNKLSSVSNNIQVDAVRDGRRQNISIFDIVVGDVVCLKIGDQIPADGLFLNGYSLQVDESSMTGETDPVEIDGSKNPFLLSGCKVVDGFASMIVTSVGMNTAWGEMMSSVSSESTERTPLQERLDKLTSYIGKVGLSVAFLVLVVLLIRYFTGNTTNENGDREFNGSKTKFNDVMNAVVRIISDAVTIVVVAIPEGLPLAVTLTLAYSMKRMMADQAMVRKLSACETMGSATTICTDKTGTLTLNQMKVTKFFLGQEAIKDEEAASKVSTSVLELLHQGVGLNTTGSVFVPASGATPEFSGSPTEKAILSWAVLELGMNLEELNRRCTILHVEAFNSEKKRSGISMRKKNDNIIHVHWKGAAEMILAMCSSYYEGTGITQAMDEAKRMKFEQIIKDMAAKSLRCIAFAYGKFQEEELEYSDGENTRQNIKEEGLTLLGLVGLKDPCRPGVRKAVEACKHAGVNIKMITGDNIFTATAIAIECGILDLSQDLNSGAVVEGVEFRNYTVEERMEKVDRICVMARSSPFDKLLMVQCLKEKGHVVAVTGDGTNDAPALKEADIGLSMGIQGTEVAKESSDIVILDDNFASVVTVLRWGRCVYNNIQKFIQFQLTVNVAALVINVIAAVSAGKVPLTAVQLLWVNLIMDTLGALALATDRPTEELMDKPPVGRKEPLITNIMWRNLIAQALYQITVLLILQFKGTVIFGVNEKVKDTLIFNTFVLCQVFNEFNARKLEKKNVFEGVLKNKLFLGIVGITIVLQVVMVEFLKKFADTERLNWGQWGACIGIAAVCWPIGWVVKCIPVSDKPLFRLLKERSS